MGREAATGGGGLEWWVAFEEEESFGNARRSLLARIRGSQTAPGGGGGCGTTREAEVPSEVVVSESASWLAAGGFFAIESVSQRHHWGVTERVRTETQMRQGPWHCTMIVEMVRQGVERARRLYELENKGRGQWNEGILRARRL